MSRIEEHAKPVPGPMLLGQSATLNLAQQVALARWAVKTSMVWLPKSSYLLLLLLLWLSVDTLPDHYARAPRTLVTPRDLTRARQPPLELLALQNWFEELKRLVPTK